MGFFSTLGSAITGIFGANKSAKQSQKNTQLTINAQKEAAELAWQNNLSLYHYNNAYNTPQAQMERLQEAGLNPNLVYGSGSVSGNTSGSLPSYPVTNPDYRGQQSQSAAFLTAASQYLDYATKSAQVDNLAAQNEMIRTQTEGAAIENMRREFDLNIERSTELPTIRKRWSESETSYNKQIESFHSSSLRGIESDIARETYPEAIELLRTELSNAKRRGENLTADLLIKVQEEYARRLENQYRELGVANGDNIAYRVIARLIQQLFPNFKF